ncbi:MAG: helix-turn-helix domain-containing protein [Gammaproteobacteria bacterium]|nr:helix-turn-helix domain-containing protein [Gammaproteobacteria bacterium]
MVHDDSQLRPETLALDALIKATVAKVRTQSDSTSPDAMLFTGNWHQAIPAMVIQDPVLEPVDKLVWMVIMLHARETGGRAAFPSYETLARQANVASTATLSRAIAILRLTRWLTLCARVRQQSGRFTGNIYVLHDEPLPLEDALYLDDAYMAFVHQSCEHHHARVRRVAQAVLDSLDEEIRSGGNFSRSESAIERRLQAANLLQASSKNPVRSGRYFTFSASALQQLNTPAAGHPVVEKGSSEMKTKALGEGVEVDQLQNSKAVEQQHSSSCSSHYKKTTTTTTTTNSNSDSKDLSDAGNVSNPSTKPPSGPPTNRPSNSSSNSSSKPTLDYPPRLSENQKLLADRYLEWIAPEERQRVLDELQGRLESEQKGMKPVYDELRFLHSLCKAAQQGEFVPNLGIKVAEARKTRFSPALPPKNAEQQASTSREQKRVQAYGLEQLAKLRQSLGLDSKT